MSWCGRALQDKCLGRLPSRMGSQGQCRMARVCRHCTPFHGSEFDIILGMSFWLDIDSAWTQEGSCLDMSGWMDVWEASSWKITQRLVMMVFDKPTRAVERKLMLS